MRVEVWVRSWDDYETVKDVLETDHGIARERIRSVEVDETRIDSDGEGNVLASYRVEIDG